MNSIETIWQATTSVSTLLNTSDDTENLLQHVCDLLRDQCAVDLVQIDLMPQPYPTISEEDNSLTFNTPVLMSDGCVLAIPLVIHNRLLGILNLQSASTAFPQASVYPLHMLANQLAHYIDVHEQMTSLRESNQLYRTNQQFMRTFISNMVHDVRTVVGAVTGWSGIILSGIDGDINDDVRDHLTIVRDSGHQLQGMINNIGAVAQLKLDSPEIIRKQVNIHDVLQNALQNISYVGRYSELKIDIEPPCTTQQEAFLDATQVEYALENLLLNAIQHLKEGSVKLSAEVDTKQVSFIVQDSDNNVNPDKLVYFFEWDWRKKKKTDFPQRGGAFDLGVVISKELVELQGGTIQVESPQEGGLRFKLDFPKTSLPV